MTTPPDTPPGTRGADRVPATLIEMRHQIGDLLETLWAARRPEELMDTIAEAEALKSTVDVLVLDVVREPEATHAVKPLGWACTQDFVTYVAGGHKSTGPAVVRLARVVAEPLLCLVEEAMRDGWLSSAKAQVITRSVDRLPDGQARREERELDREERAAHLDRCLSVKDDAGGAWIKGRCSSEDAVQIRSTLVEVCHDAQTTNLLPTGHGAVPRVSVTIGLEDLKNQTGYGTTGTGEDLSPPDGPPDGLRRGPHPHRPRVRRGAPRRRPTPAPRHTGDLEGPGRPRPAPPPPALHQTTADDPRPPHQPLGRQRTDKPAEPDPALRPPPPPHPRRTLEDQADRGQGLRVRPTAGNAPSHEWSVATR
jgi:hypothetical protein